MQQPQAPMPNMQNPWSGPVDDMVGRYPPGSIESPIRFAPGFGPGQPNMPMDKMYREPPMYQGPGMPQMPQPSANMGGQYRLSPGMYGSREQAMQQYNDQLRQMELTAMPQYNKR